MQIYEADNAIDNVALREKADGRTQLKPRLATDYDKIYQDSIFI